LLTLTACGGGGSPTNGTGSNEKVNFLGTWNYALTTSGSPCDGFIAKGLVTINANGSNTSEIETTPLVGNGMDLDSFGTSIFAGRNETFTEDVGDPAEATANEYIADIKADNAGDETIEDSRLVSFNDSKIVYEEEYKNGVTNRIISHPLILRLFKILCQFNRQTKRNPV
jgi:hypothetical protein